MSISNPSIFLQLSAAFTPAGPFKQPLQMNDSGQPQIGVGSSAGNASGIYTASRSVTAGTPDVVNLLSLTDPFGVAITAGHLIAVHIQSPSGTAAGVTLTMGGGTNPVFPAGRPIGPGGDDFWQDVQNGGVQITSGSAQNLQVTASSGTVTYTLTLFVRSA